MRLWIKICGLRSAESVAAAVEAGADAIGFVFFARSPRHVSPDEAARLAAPARGKAEIVALTVGADDAALADMITVLKPDMLQLHGSEPPERVAQVKEIFGLSVMKAVGIAALSDLTAARAYVRTSDRLLLDAKPPKGARSPGGNGVTFDWNILQGLDPPLSFVLSGGLDADGVAAAIRLARPCGVDVSSGVERAPGDKDPDKIIAFVSAARAAENSQFKKTSS